MAEVLQLRDSITLCAGMDSATRTQNQDKLMEG